MYSRKRTKERNYRKNVTPVLYFFHVALNGCFQFWPVQYRTLFFVRSSRPGPWSKKYKVASFTPLYVLLFNHQRSKGFTKNAFPLFNINLWTVFRVTVVRSSKINEDSVFAITINNKRKIRSLIEMMPVFVCRLTLEDLRWINVRHGIRHIQRNFIEVS